jgi:hypothetical protein
VLVQFSARPRFLCSNLASFGPRPGFSPHASLSAPIDFALRVVFLVKSFSQPRFSSSSSHRFRRSAAGPAHAGCLLGFGFFVPDALAEFTFPGLPYRALVCPDLSFCFGFPLDFVPCAVSFPLRFFLLLSSPGMRAGFGSDLALFLQLYLNPSFSCLFGCVHEPNQSSHR